MLKILFSTLCFEGLRTIILRMKPYLVCCAVLVCLLSLSGAEQPARRPDFSGRWLLDLDRSSIKGDNPPVSSIFVIQHKEPRWRLSRTHIYSSGKSDTQYIDLITTERKESVRREGSYTVSSRMYWEGDSLVLDEKISGPGGWRGTNLVKYSLADNGKTLIALEREEDSKSKTTNRWVFYNKPAPPPPKPGEAGIQKGPTL